MIKNILFDLDGVLFDGATLHKEVFLNALKSVIPSIPITAEYHDLYLNGLSTKQKLDYLVNNNTIDLSQVNSITTIKQTLTEATIRSLDIPYATRIQSILSQLSNYKLFCVTNSIQKTAELVLDRMGIRSYFTGVISNESISTPKPSPAIYEHTFTAYSLVPEECLILEDSVYGRTAAYATNAHVLPVVDTVDLTLEKIQQTITSLSIPKHKKQIQRVNIVVPMAGRGSRFSDKGYTVPKPFIPVFGKPMIQWVIENILPSKESYGDISLETTIHPIFHFVVQEEHLRHYNLDAICKSLNIEYTITKINTITEGPACTVLLTKEYINTDLPLITINSDQFLDWNINEFYRSLLNPAYNGCINTFYQPNPNDAKWSYAKIDPNGCVTDVAEKVYISDLATTGVYGWKHGSEFVKYAEQMILENNRVKNEFYVCPVYDYLTKAGGKVRTLSCKKLWGLGVPEDLEDFLQYFPGK